MRTPVRVLRWVLLALGVLVLVVANLLWWVDRTIFDSDRFAGAVDETLAKPEVQDRLATAIAEEAAKELDVQSQLQQRLPDDFKFLAGFAGNEIEETVVHRVALRLLSSGLTADLRNEVVGRLHARMVSILESDDAMLRAEGDELVLDLRPVINEVFDRVGVAVPARIQQAESEGRGVVVLLEDTQGLEAASFFVSNRTVFRFVTLLLAVACFAGVVYLYPDRAMGASRAGFGIAATGIITLLAIFIVKQAIPSERIVLQEFAAALLSYLRLQSIVLVAIGAVIALVADPTIRRSLASAKVSVETYTQRLGTGTPLLIAVGVAGLVLFLA